MSKPRGKSRGLSYLKEARPEAVTHLLAFFKESARHLDPKTRFLISVVTKVISNSPRGLAQYVRRALDEGATPDEILDAVLCAYPCAGLTRVVDAVDTILELDLPGFEELGRAPENEEARGDGAGGEGAGDALPATPPPSVPEERGGGLSQVILEEAPTDWFDVGERAELDEGRRIRVLAGRHDVAVFRVGEELFAVGNRCPHAGAPLSEGYLQETTVVCPLHAWRFDLRTGRSCDFPRVSVPSYEVKEEGGRILVRFPLEAAEEPAGG